MEAISELVGFVSAIGDEVSHILFGDGEEPQAPTDEPVRPLVIAGPSGVGKGTIIQMLMKEYPSTFGFSVSHTTRAPREGEQDGVHYHFTDRSTMAAMIAAGDFLESADVHGNYYGTSKAAIAAVAAKNQICILDIDVQGVQQVRKAALEPSPIFIFINPPSLEELESRLRGRGTETEDKIQKRLSNARSEMDYAAAEDGANFDYVFVNDVLADCYDSIKTFIEPNLEAVRREVAKTNAKSTPSSPTKESATTETKPQPATNPPAESTESTTDLAKQIADKQAELDAAMAAQDRAKAKTLMTELEALESQQQK